MSDTRTTEASVSENGYRVQLIHVIKTYLQNFEVK